MQRGINMQNKPHYKCPYIAGYMNKNFGVQYIRSERVVKQGATTHYIGMPTSLVMLKEKNDGHLGVFESMDDYKFYITPESMSIFKAKDGDMDKDGCVYDSGSWDKWEMDVCKTRDVSKTVFRGGKHFFWYEE